MFCSPSSSDADPEQASRLTKTTSGLGHGSGRTRAPMLETGLRAWWAQTKAFESVDSGSQKKRWGPAFMSRGGLEDVCALLRWVSFPLVRAPMSGLSGSLRTAISRPGATPTALLLRQGLGSAWAAGECGDHHRTRSTVAHSQCSVVGWFCTNSRLSSQGVEDHPWQPTTAEHELLLAYEQRVVCAS